MSGYFEGHRVLSGITLILLSGVLCSASVHAQELSLPGAVDMDTLESLRARQNISSVQLSEITSSAGLSNTYMEGVIATGDNILGPGALEHFHGIGSVIQNTGNNVLIQESLILNVNLSP
ncbi:hypothetical protein [Ectothiorhodospira shaposhnikovii]|uniref:hypothetical protein n=1 Tax=Ectothiorhodospira shaposhnikovii TaxID=1054 RepID=UPI001907C846|nr:hypothetical protein [Ectothiorhodospira shaposhnikovii]